jgi:hypothetical protein
MDPDDPKGTVAPQLAEDAPTSKVIHETPSISKPEIDVVGPESMYTYTQTLSMVSPHAFAEHARHVSATTGALEHRIAILESQNNEREMTAAATAAALDGKLEALLGGRLDPMFAALTERVDSLVAATEAKVCTIVAGLEPLRVQLQSEVDAAVAMRQKLEAADQGSVSSLIDRLVRVEASGCASAATLEAAQARIEYVRAEATAAAKVPLLTRARSITFL